MSPVVLMLLTAIVKGMPDIERGVLSLLKLAAGAPLGPEEHQALGAALEAAHKRAQGVVVTPPAA